VVGEIEPSGEGILSTGEEILPTGDEILPTGEEILPPGEEILPPGEEILPPGEAILSSGEGILSIGDGNESVDDVAVQPVSDVTEPGVAGKYPADYINEPAYDLTEQINGAIIPSAEVTVQGVEAIIPSTDVTEQAAAAKYVYFTVDDGPSDLTGEFLDIFENHGIKATFFTIGNKLSRYSDQVKRMYDGGHLLANHSYSHQYNTIYASKANLFNDIGKWDKAMSDVLGFDYHTDMFRFPGGSTFKKAVKYRDAVKGKGYTYFDWNCLNGDAQLKDRSVENLYDYMIKTFVDNGDVIVLFHDTNYTRTTVDMLERAILFFKGQGYEARLLSER
jgi:peptidoglycan/xylan/chitin deacetylase (PgdA/CDA1 family)